MLTFTTSQTKKRKLSPPNQQSQDPGSHPDLPLSSVEGRGSPSPSDSIPQFDLPDDVTPHSTVPQHLRSFSSSHQSTEYSLSAASSPSAAYAGLSIETERGVEGGSGTGSGSGQRQSSLAPNEQGGGNQSPINLFTHRAIMGDAEDMPKRASSPLKRPAAELEEDESNQAEDVDMITVPALGSPEPAKATSKLSRSDRAQSVNMLENEAVPTTTVEADITEAPRTRPKSPSSGRLVCLGSKVVC